MEQKWPSKKPATVPRRVPRKTVRARASAALARSHERGERLGPRERETDGKPQRGSDEERTDQYHAIHAEIISLSTVSGGSRVAWLGMAWRGVAWCGVRYSPSLSFFSSPFHTLRFSRSVLVPPRSRQPSLCVSLFSSAAYLPLSLSSFHPASLCRGFALSASGLRVSIALARSRSPRPSFLRG